MWTLTKQALDEFLSRLHPDRDQAGLIYEQIRGRLTTLFRCRGFWDAEVLVDETLDRVIRRTGEVDISNLMSFVHGVARRVASEAYRSSVCEMPLDDMRDATMPEGRADEQASAERRFRCLDECAGHLGNKDRELIINYYRFDKSQKIENKREMAEALGIAAGALRVRAFRTRQRLERCIAHCMGDGSGVV